LFHESIKNISTIDVNMRNITVIDYATFKRRFEQGEYQVNGNEIEFAGLKQDKIKGCLYFALGHIQGGYFTKNLPQKNVRQVNEDDTWIGARDLPTGSTRQRVETFLMGFHGKNKRRFLQYELNAFHEKELNKLLQRPLYEAEYPFTRRVYEPY
jgi:hypothetical protein